MSSNNTLSSAYREQIVLNLEIFIVAVCRLALIHIDFIRYSFRHVAQRLRVKLMIHIMTNVGST